MLLDTLNELYSLMISLRDVTFSFSIMLTRREWMVRTLRSILSEMQLIVFPSTIISITSRSSDVRLSNR